MKRNSRRTPRWIALALALACLLSAVPGGAMLNLKLRQLQTPAPTAPPLRLHSSGDRVRNLQKQLIKYGYLEGTADGEYGPLTERAVLLFQMRYGLSETGAADAATVAKLTNLLPLSGSYYMNRLSDSRDLPPLVLSGWFQHRKLKNDRVEMRLKVTNVDPERTVDHFTVTAFFEDPYGVLVLSDHKSTWDTRKKIKPGKSTHSNYQTFWPASSLYTCKFAITRMHCTNGDVIEIDSADREYMTCTYKG